jgi:hypothetical protein
MRGNFLNANLSTNRRCRDIRSIDRLGSPDFEAAFGDLYSRTQNFAQWLDAKPINPVLSFSMQVICLFPTQLIIPTLGTGHFSQMACFVTNMRHIASCEVGMCQEPPIQCLQQAG